MLAALLIAAFSSHLMPKAKLQLGVAQSNEMFCLISLTAKALSKHDYVNFNCDPMRMPGTSDQWHILASLLDHCSPPWNISKSRGCGKIQLCIAIGALWVMQSKCLRDQ